MGFRGSFAQVIEATQANARCISSQLLTTTVQGISTDTRTLSPAELFFALSGENFDGHQFVDQAIAQGAMAAVVSENWAIQTENFYPLLIVKDPLRAYQDLAHWWRSQWDLPVIAITGSAGKTTTKELISKLLSYYTPSGKQVHRSKANHNNDIGVAQTLLEVDPNLHSFVVIEMGMRGTGEIARLADMAAPTVGVITNIGTAHIGRLGDQQAIASAKCELLEHLSTGVAILNGEDRLLLQTADQVWRGKTITYGLGVGDISGEWDGNSLKVAAYNWNLPLPGRHNALNFLAALGVVNALGLSWFDIPQDLGELELPAGRAQIHYLPRSVTILDETYNASAEAVIAALDLLNATSGKRRFAVLGTMKELGEMSDQLHQKVGKTVAQLKIDYLLVLTDGESDAILTGAGEDFMFKYGCSDRLQLTQKLLELVQPGDTILFKASHSVQMNKVVQEFQTAWHT